MTGRKLPCERLANLKALGIWFVTRCLPGIILMLVSLGRAGAQQYHEYPANRVTGVNVDQFLGSWTHSETTVTHGVLIKRVILKNGDPEKPGPPGAVLEFHKKLSAAALEGGAHTPPVRHAEQEILYSNTALANCARGSGHGLCAKESRFSSRRTSSIPLSAKAKSVWRWLF